MPALGVCYYPEHWPEEIWSEDAARMSDLGLTWVRIGEFAWSRLEPSEGELRFDWLDSAIEVLGAAGLQVILGTPTATPPRWVVDKHPGMLPVGRDGQPRGFGSRRHYCFSHEGYLTECGRIVAILAERYGRNQHVQAWQIDNEYGCHDTTISWSDAALHAFRDWLAQRYQSPDALNGAWGNIFWSMEYQSFDEVGLPNRAVTEVNPSHAMAFRRFSSDQVRRFNSTQVDILRRYTDAPLIHNYMGRITDFDHYDVGSNLDIASWDSYPLGFLQDRIDASEDDKRTFARQGDPDFQAFHHDLYRSVGRGRLWVMEQQPGPVNWAPWNPAPLPGMARLWAWEALAHGAETVSYFRWRQAPFAQEQMHTGLLRPDGVPAPALAEVEQVACEIREMPDFIPAQAKVAIVFDYASQWAWEVQPQGADFDYFELVFSTYRAFRQKGISLDIIPADTTTLSHYRLVLVPGLITMSENLQTAILETEARIVLGPRFNSKTDEFSITIPMPPTVDGLDATVTAVESLPPGISHDVAGGGEIRRWFEFLESTEPTLIQTTDGLPVLIGERIQYLAGWPDTILWDRLAAYWLDTAEVSRMELADGVRVRDTANHRFVFNYGPTPATYDRQIIEPGDLFWSPLVP